LLSKQLNSEINQNWVSFFKENPILYEKIILFGYDVHFIDLSDGIICSHKDCNIFHDELGLLLSSFRQLDHSTKERQVNKEFWQQLDAFTEFIKGIRYPLSLTIRHFRKDQNFCHFLVFTGDKGEIPIFDIARLINIAEIEHNRFPIHASGVMDKKGLYLFGGPSGAGKSTLSSLSKNSGHSVLDEDQLLLRDYEDSYITANAWGYSLQKNDLPLKAVFRLVKSENNLLVKSTKFATAKFLMQQILEVTGVEISGTRLKQIYSFCSKLARSIPGYELHFRKSPDVWKLIDAEFGLE
jgi:hypothetical protein